jgi:hypothetical protein
MNTADKLAHFGTIWPRPEENLEERRKPEERKRPEDSAPSGLCFDAASAHPPQAHLANLITARAKDPRHPMPATTAGALKKKAKSGTSFSFRKLAMASRIAIATANAKAMSNHPHHSK